jgi:DNA polymerase-3 subunit delta
MKLAYQQLAQHLAKSLAPIYLISSDELLLAQEAIDTIRSAAKQAGFTERVTITPESGSDWGDLIYTDSHSLSLFATKKIIEVNLNLIKFNAATGKILAEYATKPLNDTLIIINTKKLDAKLEKSAWFQAIDKVAVTLAIWPLTTEQLPAWIMQRAKKINLTITKPAADRLTSLVEGNLLAAAQEIEKLSLLQTDNTITEQLIDEAVTDNSRFDIFNLVDSALSGNTKRSIHMLKNLAAEGEEPTLILWALTRELRVLTEMLQQQKRGLTLANIFSQFRVWEKRQPGVRACLQRNNVESVWHKLIHAAQIDRIIKGAESGNVWDELEKLVVSM